MTDSAIPEEIQRVLVTAAHPDDPEFSCAATVAKWAAMGRDVTYLILTSGDKGSHDPTIRPGQIAAEREAEQRAAAAVLGVKEVLYLNYADGVLENTLELRRRLSLVIRELRPDLILAIDPWRHYQLHPDHRAAGQAVLDALWSAREWNIFPEQLLGDRQPWRTKEAWLYWAETPDHWEDVSETVHVRIDALRHHATQLGDRADTLEDRVREWLRETAKGHNLEYAEAFKRIKF